MSSAARIQHLPANTRGRDLIIGDLHGQRALLNRALDELSFDPAADRLISVGDLVDRGPDSIGCLRLLRERWFHAVMGNHEGLMLDAVTALRESRPTDGRLSAHVSNGGEWLMYRWPWPADDEIEELLSLTQQLPHVLVVGAGVQRYNVVHGELPGLVRDVDIDAGEVGRAEALMWGRTLFGGGRHESLPPPEGLSTTYCGHTYCADEDGLPCRSGGHVCLDTGVHLGLDLSIAVRNAPGRETVRQFSATAGE